MTISAAFSGYAIETETCEGCRSLTKYLDTWHCGISYMGVQENLDHDLPPSETQPFLPVGWGQGHKTCPKRTPKTMMQRIRMLRRDGHTV